MRARTIRLTFAFLAIAFFAGPIALRAVGVAPETFENRRFADAPELSQGWDAFQQTSRFLTDRMPLRAEAVRANTRLWTELFDTVPRYGSLAGPGRQPLPVGGNVPEPAGGAQAPALEVLEGEDGWLFLEQELDEACNPSVPYAKALARWGDLVSAVRRSGRRAIVLVAPDKGSVYPEYLPADRVRDCAVAGKRRLWRLLRERADAGGVVGLRDMLMRSKARAGDDLYARKDSHWTSVGALSMAAATLDALGHGIAVEPGEIGPRRRVSYVGDLTVLLGASEEDFEAHRSIRRAPGAPRVADRTLLVGDSFSRQGGPHLRHYFSDTDFVSWNTPDVDRIADAVAAADVVIFQTVERIFTGRALDDGPVVALLPLVRGLDPP